MTEEDLQDGMLLRFKNVRHPDLPRLYRLIQVTAPQNENYAVLQSVDTGEIYHSYERAYLFRSEIWDIDVWEDPL